MAINLFILGAIIGSNNLAAALALGAIGAKTHRPRILLAFGTFEFLVPLLGLWLGRQAANLVAQEASCRAIG